MPTDLNELDTSALIDVVQSSQSGQAAKKRRKKAREALIERCKTTAQQLIGNQLTVDQISSISNVELVEMQFLGDDAQRAAVNILRGRHEDIIDDIVKAKVGYGADGISNQTLAEIVQIGKCIGGSDGRVMEDRAMTILIDRHRSIINKLKGKSALSPSEAESGIIFGLWTAAIKSTGYAKFTTYAYRWMFRNAIVRANRQKTLPTLSSNNECASPFDLFVGQEGDNVDVKIDVERAISCLSERHRNVVMKRFFEGLSTREIAEEIGTTVVTVRRILKKAMSALAEQLGGYRKTEDDEEFVETGYSLAS